MYTKEDQQLVVKILDLSVLAMLFLMGAFISLVALPGDILDYFLFGISIVLFVVIMHKSYQVRKVL